MSTDPHAPVPAPTGTTRRGFLKIVVVGGSSLVVGNTLFTREEIQAQEPPDFFDLGDALVSAETPYFLNLVLEVTPHNRVRFELPRLDKGQGILTSVGMLVAECLDADYERTDVTLSDARADRPYSLTGYSHTIRAMWEWVPLLAAEARARLITAAANRWEIVDASTLTTRKSMVIAPDGRRASYGELASEAAAVVVPLVVPVPKPIAEFSLVGSERTRRNAREIVTGQQKYTLDLDFPANTAWVVVARPPDIYGTVQSFDASAALGLPNVYGATEIPQTPGPLSSALEGGVAVGARTLKEAFDARDALQISWGAGPLATTSENASQHDLRDQLVANALPLLLPALPGSTLEAAFDFPYMSHAPLEVQSAAAIFDAGSNSCEVWYPSQAPLYTAQLIAGILGIPEANVTLHVTPCGGSFGRHLFSEAAVEAAYASQQLGRPVKLMYSRNDDMRSGRFRPLSHSDLRATWEPLTGEILTYEHNVSAAETDFRHGLGDAASASTFDVGALGLNQSVFYGSVTLPYQFPVKNQKLVETQFEVPTCSWRSIYSGFVMSANEVFVDALARATQPLSGRDELAFREHYLTDPQALACLQQVAAMGNWGAPLPAGHAQGLAVHSEFRSRAAYLVQVDATDPANPRLTHAWVAADVGVPMNPKGIEAQLQGVLVDAWTVMFRAGNTLTNGRIDQGSYGDFYWARMNQVAPTTEVYVFPASTQPGASPGGVGELGVVPACAACVNAYARAVGSTGNLAYEFPIQTITEPV